jgi:hypothetical protein
MKIKALTIIDIVITLAISTFIVMMSAIVYFIINKQYNNYKIINHEINEIHQFASVFTNDFNEADILFFSSAKNSIVIGSIDSIEYNLNEDRVIRRFKRDADTFGVILKNFECFKGGTPIVNGAIDKIIVEIATENCRRIFNLNYIKDYSSETLMNLDKQKLDLDKF